MILRRRFIILFLILTIVGMCSSNVIYYFISKTTLLASLHRQLLHQADAVVKLMDEAVANIQLNFVYFSGDATLTTVVQEVLGEVVEDSARSLLVKIKSDYGYYETLLVADIHGVVISGSNAEEIGIKIKNTDYFQASITGQFYISDVFPSPFSGAPVFRVSGPLYMGGEIVGIIAGIVKVSYFIENYMAAIKVSDKGFAFIFRKDGMVIAHKNASKIFKENFYSLHPDLKGPIEQDRVREYSQNGLTYLTALRHSAKMSWTVGVSAAEADFLKPIRQLSTMNILVLTVVSVFIVLAVSFLINIINRQLKEILNLKVAKEGAEAASVTKSEFLANMSHEIRTPMNAVLGFTELLKKEIADPRQKSYLEAIWLSGKNLLQLINDILDLSRIEAGKLSLNPEPLNLRQIITETQKIFELQTKAKGLDVLLEIDATLPATVELDEIRLRQVLVNLLGNAVKFTEKGFIRVSVENGGATRLPDHYQVIIKVTDTGIGIPKASLETIFHSFTQAEGHDAKSFGGTGLGLTITRHLIEMMNGSISVTSREGHGATFKITLNQVKKGTLPLPLKEEESFDASTVRFNGQIVLVVDDNTMNQEFIAAALTPANLQVLKAGNGTQGVICARQYDPDLIFMDLKMPQMGGYEALQIIRSETQLKSIPVIALTASVTPEEKNKILSSSFDDFVFKPIKLTDLFRITQKYISPAQKAGGRTEAVCKNEKSPLASISKENLTKSLAALEALEAHWHQVTESQFIPDIQSFSQKLTAIGQETDNARIRSFAQALIQHMESYDIEKMIKVLNEYPELILMVKKELNSV